MTVTTPNGSLTQFGQLYDACEVVSRSLIDVFSPAVARPYGRRKALPSKPDLSWAVARLRTLTRRSQHTADQEAINDQHAIDAFSALQSVWTPLFRRPAIADSGEGGVVLFWSAGRDSIECIFDAEGYFLRMKIAGELFESEGRSEAFDPHDLSLGLRRLATPFEDDHVLVQGNAAA